MNVSRWVLAWSALWVVLLAAGVWFLAPVFTYACDDCIGGGPTPSGYYFGEGGFVTEWGTVVFWSVLVASFVTGLLWVGSRALRRRANSSGLLS
jgi:hypothetical protein